MYSRKFSLSLPYSLCMSHHTHGVSSSSPTSVCSSHYHFSPSTERVVRGTRQTEVLFRSFPQEALVSSSGTGRRDVHIFMLSMQQFRCPPRRRPEEMFSGETAVTCDMPPNHASFPLVTRHFTLYLLPFFFLFFNKYSAALQCGTQSVTH